MARSGQRYTLTAGAGPFSRLPHFALHMLGMPGTHTRAHPRKLPKVLMLPWRLRCSPMHQKQAAAQAALRPSTSPLGLALCQVRSTSKRKSCCESASCACLHATRVCTEPPVTLPTGRPPHTHTALLPSCSLPFALTAPRKPHRPVFPAPAHG